MGITLDVHPVSDTPSATQDDIRWAAVLARDPSADGRFVYAVKTTGVYAAPSAASRLPKRENVTFFDSAQDAQAAGFRASNRSASDRSTIERNNAHIVAQACRHIEQSDTLVSLDELARQAGLSRYHFHRLFKSVMGLTPRAFAQARRSQKVRVELTRKSTVTGAIYDAGFNANSRFYEQSNDILGMTPTAYRRGGLGTDIKFAIGQCSLGAILVARSNQGVCAITLGDDPQILVNELQDRFPKATLVGADADFEQLVAQVVGLIEAPALGLALPLDVRGTAFQQRVWQALRDIAPGTTATYAQIAERIGSPKAVRAVAGACAANSLAVAIPCHRVVRSDGSLSGYRWGVQRKRALLDRESD